MRCFSADLTALQTADLAGTNRNTINRIYLGLRQRILTACEEARPMFGVVEVDESGFGPREGQARAWRLQQDHGIRDPLPGRVLHSNA